MSNSSLGVTRRAKALVSTTIALTASTLFARTIVVYYNVYLSGKIGAAGIGVFELLMSVYTFAKTASTAGVSLAATRMSAEESGFFKQTMQRILFCCLLLGALCGGILVVLAPFLCERILNQPPGGVPALQILACALPFLSMSSAYSGYFVAKRKMRTYAPIQIFEQLLRVGLTILLLEKFSQNRLSFSICSISLAITLSEVLAFLFSLIFYSFITRHQRQKNEKKERFKDFFKTFSRLALPVGGGAVFRASLNTVYNILVPRGLRKSGASSEGALASYGTVQGMALPVLLYPSALMGVVSLQLVPEIASLRAAGNHTQISYMTKRVLHFTLLFAIICAGVLFFFAEELSLLIFQKSNAAYFIRVLAPLVPVMYLDTVTDGILKGLDLQMKVLTIGIVDSIISLAFIYFLLPPFAIRGYLLTIYAGECVNTLLGQIELRRHVDVRFSAARSIFLPICAISGACLLTKYLFSSKVVSTPAICLLILAAVCLCGSFLCLTGALNREETQWIHALFRFQNSFGAKKSGSRNKSQDTQTRVPCTHKNMRMAGKASKSEI